jgi:hypothetical protein
MSGKAGAGGGGSDADVDGGGKIMFGFREKDNAPATLPHVTLAKFRRLGHALVKSMEDGGFDQPSGPEFMQNASLQAVSESDRRKRREFGCFLRQRVISGGDKSGRSIVVARREGEPVVHERESATHTSLAGGKYIIDESSHNDFCALYVDALRSGELLSLNEIGNETFPMFFDIDLRFALSDLERPADGKDDASLNWIDRDLFHSMIALVPPMIREIVRWYTGSAAKSHTSAKTTTTTTTAARCNLPNLMCFVMSNERALPEFDARAACMQVRLGYHIVFPFLIVNRDIALALHTGCLAAVRRFVTELPSPNTWDLAMDAGVYNGGAHIRMPFCYKAEKCTGDCQGKRAAANSRDAPCSTCKGSGTIFTNRRYSLVCCMSYEDGEVVFDSSNFEMCAHDPVRLVKTVSLRRFDRPVTRNFAPYKGAPRYIDTRQSRHDGGGGGGGACGVPQIGRGKKFYVTRQSPVWTALEPLVQSFDRIYARTRIKDILTNQDSTWYKIIVDGEGSHYCRNIERDHNSATVYFFVSKSTQTLVQKCWCQCKTLDGRGGKFCSDYESPGIPLGNNDRVLLFPHSSNVNNGSRFMDSRKLARCGDENEVKKFSNLERMLSKEEMKGKFVSTANLVEESSLEGSDGKSSRVFISSIPVEVERRQSLKRKNSQLE